MSFEVANPKVTVKSAREALARGPVFGDEMHMLAIDVAAKELQKMSAAGELVCEYCQGGPVLCDAPACSGHPCCACGGKGSVKYSAAEIEKMTAYEVNWRIAAAKAAP